MLAFLYGIEDLETARFEQCLPWDHEDGQINRILWQATLTAMWAALTAPAAAAFAVDKLSQAQMNQIRNMLVSAKVLDPALRNGLWQLDTQLFVRTNRSLELTRAGQLLARKAKVLLNEEAQFTSFARELRGKITWEGDLNTMRTDD